MKTTAVCRYDGTAFLHWENKLMTFLSYEDLEKYVEENGIKVEIRHYHPAGIKVDENGKH